MKKNVIESVTCYFTFMITVKCMGMYCYTDI